MSNECSYHETEDQFTGGTLSVGPEGGMASCRN
jgi:hypothetical protein